MKLKPDSKGPAGKRSTLTVPLTAVLSLLLCLFTTLNVSATGQISGKKVTLDMRNVTLQEVLDQLKEQTGNYFIFNSADMDLNTRVDAVYTDVELGKVLEDILRRAGSGLSYKEVENFIVIVKQDEVSRVQAAGSRRTVTGKVVSEDGQPVVGASIWIKETALGTASDVEGNYSISFDVTNPVIVVSYIGYSNVEEVVGGRTVINFILVPEAEEVEQIVVVGYGTQRKESVIGAMSTITSENLKIPSAKVSTALAGQLAGIVSVQRSGEPGSGSDFWIRGISTFGVNKTPLVLVDGIERSLDYVDPEDIETFSILKDATATAVYGVRGANGVILVTTRRGEEGRPQITVRAEAGLTGPTQMPNMVNSVQFAELYNEAFRYERNSVFYSDETIQKYRDGSDPYLYPNVDWLSTLYKNFSSNQRVNANVSGGGSIARYYISGSFYNEGSILKEDKMRSYNSSVNYKKFNFRSNVDVSLSGTTVLNVNLANIYEVKNSPGESLSDIWSYSFQTSPNAFPVKYPDGKLSGPQDTGKNPYNLLTQSGYSEDYWNTAQALIGVTQDFSFITPGLKGNIKFSWDASNSNNLKRLAKPYIYTATDRDENGDLVYQQVQEGSPDLTYSRSNGGHRVFYLEGSFSYEHLFNMKHRVGGLILYNQKQLNYVAKDKSEEALPYRNQGIAARMTYSYDNRYFFEANCGYNGSENFAPGKRFGFFPAGAVGWLISEEPFYRPVKRVMDMLKLKASYGLVGNDQISNSRRFIYLETIKDPSGGYALGKTHSEKKGIQMEHFSNTGVSWEEAYKMNLGIEVSFLRELTIQADYFQEKRRGIFMQRNSIPGFVGITTMPYVNVGKVNNRGYDMSLEYYKKLGEVRLSIRGNYTYNRNKIVDDDQPDWKYEYQSKIGKPVDQQFGLVAEGLFRTQEEIDNSPKQTFGTVRVGDIKYRDINGDGVIDAYDEVAIGRSTIPEIVYGFGFSLQYKGFDLSAFFQGIGNATFFMSGGAVRPFTSDNLYRSNMYEDVYTGRWTEANPDPNAVFPRLSLGNNLNNYRNSTYWQRSGSFIRLKTVEIGYTLPRHVSSKMRLEHLRLYVTGLNLLTFSGFKLWDPEMGGPQGQGYPPNRVISFGIKMNL